MTGPVDGGPTGNRPYAAGDAATLASANATSAAGDVATLASANAARITGDATTLASANATSAAGDVATLATAVVAMGLLASTADLNLIRYWFVDYDGGSDGNAGYIDAASGSTFTTLQTSAVAIKTLEKLAQLMARTGNGRRAVVLIKKRALGSFYRNVADTANDVLDLRGHQGYELEIIRGSTDLSNDATDRVLCGGVLNPAGPDAGGAYTISSVTDAWTFGIATTPWTVDQLEGRRVRFASDASAPYAGQCMTIQSNAAGQVVLSVRISATLPLVGDKFYVETPGFQVDRILLGEMYNAYRPTATSSAAPRRAMAGISFASSSAISFFVDSGQFAFIEQSAVTTNTVTFASSGPLSPALNVHRTYADETGTVRTVGGCLFNAPVSMTSYAMLLSSACFKHPTSGSAFSYARSGIQGGTRFNTAPTLTGVGWAPGPAGLSSGSQGLCYFGQVGAPTNASRRNRIDAGTLTVSQSSVELIGLQFSGTAAYILLRGQGCDITLDDFIGSTGTDVCVDATALYDSSVIVGTLGTAIAATASLGAIRMNGGGIVAAFADLAARTVIDQHRNRFSGSGVLVVENGQQLAADPSSPFSGDEWSRTDNKLARRGSDAVTRYLTYVEPTIIAEVASRTTNPATLPASGNVKVFYRSDTQQLCVMDSTGAVKTFA